MTTRRIDRDDIDNFHSYGVHMKSRTIYMGSEGSDEDGESGCDAFMAEKIIKNLLLLEQESNDPITIIMNNIGGDTYHCFAIYDAVKACKSKVIIKVLGHAMSAGSIILQAGDERIMGANARQMIHYGHIGITSHAKTAQKIAEENKKNDKWMEQMYLNKIKEKNVHYTLQRLQRILDHDTFLTAQESVELGLADKVLE